MSEGEYKIADTKGRFAMAVKDGRQLNNVDWSQGRILLSNRRLILAGNDGKRTIALSDITGLSGRQDASQSIAAASNYLALKLGEDVMLVSATDHDEFKTAFFKAVLDENIVKAKHPAVEGGVVQDTSCLCRDSSDGAATNLRVRPVVPQGRRTPQRGQRRS